MTQAFVVLCCTFRIPSGSCRLDHSGGNQCFVFANSSGFLCLVSVAWKVFFVRVCCMSSRQKGMLQDANAIYPKFRKMDVIHLFKVTNVLSILLNV